MISPFPNLHLSRKVPALSLATLAMTACYLPQETRTPSVVPSSDAPTPTGNLAGPEELRAAIEYDAGTTLLSVSVTGAFRERLNYPYDHVVTRCSKEAQPSKFRANYITGVSLAGGGGLFLGLDSTVLRGLNGDEPGPLAYAGGALIGSGVLLAGAAMLVDVQHDSDEQYDCQATTIGQEFQAGLGPSRRRAVSDYEVMLSSSGLPSKRYRPDDSATTRLRLAVEFQACPERFLLQGEKLDPLRPGITPFVITNDISVSASRQGTEIASETVSATVVEFSRYLRTQADRLVSLRGNNESVLSLKFVVENKYSRVPIHDADIRVSILAGREPEVADVTILPESKQLEQQLRLASLPCDPLSALATALASAQRAREEKLRVEREGKQRQTCGIRNKMCAVRSNALGEFDIDFFRDTTVLIEVRKEDYHFFSRKVVIGKDIVLGKDQETFIEKGLDGTYRLLLADVGQKVRTN